MKPSYQLDGQAHAVSPVRQGNSLTLNIDGHDYDVVFDRDVNPQTLVLNGVKHELYVASDGDDIYIQLGGRQWHITAINPIDAVTAGTGGADRVLAPMPGVVVSVAISVGDTVSEGQTLLTIESMKLQTAIVADRDGTIAEIGFNEAETFDKGATLVCFEANDKIDA